MSVCRGEQVGWIYETDATARRDRLDGRPRKSQSRLAGTSRHPPTIVTPASHVTPHPSSPSTMSSAVLRQAAFAVCFAILLRIGGKSVLKGVGDFTGSLGFAQVRFLHVCSRAERCVLVLVFPWHVWLSLTNCSYLDTAIFQRDAFCGVSVVSRPCPGPLHQGA